MLLGCELTEKNEPPGGEAVSYVAANLLGYNNVADTNINWFSVNGYQGRTGGFTCCVSLPEQWQPNMKVEVEWEMDPDPFPKNMPSLGTDQFRSFMKEHEANYRHHKTVVTIPEYQESCGLQVHFLPCQQVKVTVTCHGV